MLVFRYYNGRFHPSLASDGSLLINDLTPEEFMVYVSKPDGPHGYKSIDEVIKIVAHLDRRYSSPSDLKSQIRKFSLLDHAERKAVLGGCW